MNDPLKSRLRAQKASYIKVIKCALCSDKWATRLSSWSATCEFCSKINSQQYNEKDIRLQVIAHTRNPRQHQGAKSCAACFGDNLVILYDEVDDEWLYCGGCRRFKQLLRCWNMYSNTMMNNLERPITRREEDCSAAERNEDFATHEIRDNLSDLDSESVTSYIVEPTGATDTNQVSELSPSTGRNSDMHSLPPLIKN